MIDRFTDWLNKQIGCAYVWGAQGETCLSETWIRKVETSDKNAELVMDFLRNRREKGLKTPCAYDSAGLVVRFLYDNDIIHSDMSSRGLYAFSKKVEKEDLEAGDLLFRHDGEKAYHVGVYVGDGEVIHSRGRAYGVVKQNIDENGDDFWNRFGRIHGLRTPAAAEYFPRPVIYAGNTYVNMRSVPSAVTSANIIDSISKDEEALLLSVDRNGWADLIKYDGERYVRGYAYAKWFTDRGVA